MLTSFGLSTTHVFTYSTPQLYKLCPEYFVHVRVGIVEPDGAGATLLANMVLRCLQTCAPSLSAVQCTLNLFILCMMPPFIGNLNLHLTIF